MEILEVGEHRFEIVKNLREIPSNFVIWNIGTNMAPDYLPFVQCGGYDGFQVNVKTMKSLKVKDAQIILSAIGGGQNTTADMKRYVKRYRNAKPGTLVFQKRQKMLKAIPILETIGYQ